MKEYTGSCHCGGVKFKFKSDELVQIWNCNCSICDMLNYQHLFVKHDLFYKQIRRITSCHKNNMNTYFS